MPAYYSPVVWEFHPLKTLCYGEPYVGAVPRRSSTSSPSSAKGESVRTAIPSISALALGAFNKIANRFTRLGNTCCKKEATWINPGARHLQYLSVRFAGYPQQNHCSLTTDSITLHEVSHCPLYFPQVD